MIHDDHLMYLKIISSISMIFLPCDIPTQIVKPLTVIKHLVSSPLDDEDKL